MRLPSLPHRTTSQVLRKRPDLLAAEARVRSAFQLEESTRLNLLPSLTLGAGASGESTALASGFRQWIASVGPRLDLPVYDPKRLAAVHVRRAGTDEAAALYRRTALHAFEEVESSYLNFSNRRRQLTAARREVAALDEARRNTFATFETGLVSQIELLESERRSLEGRRQELAVRHALLRDHLALVKALGGS
ncbi:MAG: TolC family protein [Nitrospirota bacterium]|nr:TolC family protein [Nitrospirota bacterium]